MPDGSSRVFYWDRLRSLPLVSTFALTLVCLAGYSLTVAGQSVSAPEKTVPVTRLVVTSGTRTTSIGNSKLPDKERVVIRDRATLESIWKGTVRFGFSLDQKNQPMPTWVPAPDIDFAKEMLILVSMGECPTSGYVISVEGAKEFSDRIEVEVKSTRPKGCVLLMMMTSPIDIVRLPSTNKTVVFHETDVVNQCK